MLVETMLLLRHIYLESYNAILINVGWVEVTKPNILT
jgi:hypothetical protein